jgi:hypothetical protein
MKPMNRALLTAAVLATAALGGCVQETMISTIQANRSGAFAVRPGQKVALVAFTGDKGAGLADLMSIEFLRHGVDVVERNVLDRVIAEVRRTEAGLYNNDLSDAEIIRQIGRITEADWVVVGDTAASDPDTIRYLKGDTGRKSPVFRFAYAQLSVRAFSTRTGEVVWWGTCETTTQAPFGSDVNIMDHLRVSARRAVDSMLNPQINRYSLRAVGRRIPAASNPLVAYDTRAAAPLPPASPPPPTYAPAPAYAPVAPQAPTAAPAGPSGGCTSDNDCPGELLCMKGTCASR